MAKDRSVGFEVVVKPLEGSKSIFDDDAFPSLDNLDAYRGHHGKSAEASRKLANNGITIEHIGEFSISATCEAGRFEDLFGTNLVEQRIPVENAETEDFVMFSPDEDSSWTLPEQDGLSDLIDRAYIQHDPILFAGERTVPPFWNDKFRLRVPGDVAQIMQASSVHKLGITGKGVKVGMPDTGFYHHPYFVENAYNFLSVTAPDALDHKTDANGHGTGECANLLAVAPGINFIGVKKGNPTLAFKTAVDLKPNVMTNSWGFPIDVPGSTMPNWLKPLYLAVLDAVAKGITVCFSAGNGHFAFPGSMPEVISVGGVYVDENLEYRATEYASGFESTWFPGRWTPDVSGLCGIPPSADYIVLPVENGAANDKEGGWGAFSGTSAASPMVAGVCALLKEADSSLTPNDIKNILKFTARDITQGQNAHGEQAVPGPDHATGFGLVDAARAINAIM